MDHRCDDRRETALSVLRALEKASNGNGAGKLLYLHFVEELSFWSFTEKERRVIAVTSRAFTCALCAADFLAPCGQPRRGCKRMGQHAVSGGTRDDLSRGKG